MNIPQSTMNYTLILLVQSQEELEEILLSSLTRFELDVVVNEPLHVETALSDLSSR